MKDIKNLSLKSLEQEIKDFGFAQFYAKSIFSWIYKKQVLDFDFMSDLPIALRQKLKLNFSIASLKLAKIQLSCDKTEKFLMQLQDNNFIEAVVIPFKDRVTACISSQVGCKFACAFCASGLLGFKRNLTMGEIVEELLLIREHSKNKKVTHVVFMGTGEPLDNYDNCLSAIRIINDPSAFGIGARRITISTSGIIPGIEKLSEEKLQVELSISLHASDEKTRDLIMPVNKKYPLADLLSACKKYIAKTNRQITFEYVLIKDVNSSLQNALVLSKILKGMNCKVNLIIANPVKEQEIIPPEKRDIELFKETLVKCGTHVTLRKSRGEDIDAACGQLRMKYEQK